MENETCKIPVTGGIYLHSFEGLRKKIELPKEERIQPADSVWTPAATATLSWISSLPAYPTDFGLARPHNHMREFLNISLIFIFRFTSHPSVSLENPDYYSHIILLLLRKSILPFIKSIRCKLPFNVLCKDMLFILPLKSLYAQV